MTPAQLATLKTAITADPTLSSQPNDPDHNQVIADAFNVDASPAYSVWRTTTPVDDISDAISWANMTPADAPDGTQAWANRALAAQGKQFNIQNLFLGRSQIATGKANIRAAIQDALTSLPTGAGGATQNANFPAVKAAITRNATRAEKLFAAGTGTAALPAALGFEGRISYTDVEQARAS